MSSFVRKRHFGLLLVQVIIPFLVIICFSMTEAKITSQAFMEAQSETGARAKQMACVRYNPKIHELPENPEGAQFTPLVDISHSNGCSPSDYNKPQSTLTGSTVAMSRGNCTFARKAEIVQSVNGSAVLIVNYKNESGPIIPVVNQTDYNTLNITVASIAWNDYQNILSLQPPVHVKIYTLQVPKFDPNMIIIVCFSTLVVLAGSLWAIQSIKSKQKASSQNRKVNSESCEEERDAEKDSEDTERGVEFNMVSVGIIAVMLCGVLVSLYFFYDYLVYVFICFFVIGGTQGLYTCTLPLWSQILPVMYGVPLHRLPCWKKEVCLRSLLLFICCAAVGIFWAVQRHASYAWIFQDILGTALCLSIMKSARMSNLKVLTIMAMFFFCYDVFFVFISPYFTKNGESIMIKVATGGSSNSGEKIPLVFLIPLVSHDPALMCSEREFSMLGFGDVVLPGILVVYNSLFGLRMGTKMYIIFSTFAYALGISLCLVGMIMMEKGQPAMLYIVPSLLLFTIGVALVRKEFRIIWKGHQAHCSKKSDEPTNPNDVEEAQNLID